MVEVCTLLNIIFFNFVLKALRIKPQHLTKHSIVICPQKWCVCVCCVLTLRATVELSLVNEISISVRQEHIVHSLMLTNQSIRCMKF